MLFSIWEPSTEIHYRKLSNLPISLIRQMAYGSEPHLAARGPDPARKSQMSVSVPEAAL